MKQGFDETVKNGEQYPLEIKPVLDTAEERLARKISSSFSRWNYKVFQWAVGIAQDFNTHNETVKKNDEKPLVPTEAELGRELGSMIVVDDFVIDNSLLAVAMQNAVGYSFDRLAADVGSKSMASAILGAMNLSFDIQYDMTLYNRILDDRKEWLAGKLYDTTTEQIPAILSKGIETGATIDQMTKAIQDVLGMDKDRAAKIARTETNHAVNEAIREQTHKLGIQKYIISTAIGACELCQMAAQKEYSYKAAQGLLPLHPNDRCVLQSVIPKSWLGIEKSIKERGIQKTIEKGYIPIKGMDYYTDDEIEQVKKAVTPVRGKDYLTKEELIKVKEEIAPKKGVDYLVEQEIESIKKAVTPIKDKDYRDGTDGYTPIKGKDYFDGEKGDPGKDGTEIEPEQIVEKLESIKEEKEKLDTKAIKNFDKEVRKRIPKVVVSGGGGGSDGKVKVDSVGQPGFLEDKLKEGANITLTKSGDQIEIAATGSLTETDPIYTSDKPNIALKSEIPTATSDLTNDSGFITSGDIPAETDPVWDSEKGDYLTTANAALTYEPLLPTTPENPETKYLNGNRQWAAIAIGAGGFAGNLYFTNLDSDVSGYKKISYDNDVTEVELSATITNQEVLARTYLYDFPLATDTIDAGVWIANYRVKVSNAVQVTQLRMQVFVYHTNTTETNLWDDYSPEINNTDYVTVRSESNQPAFSVADTDRLGVRIYMKTTAPTAVTINTIIGDGDASYFTTPLRIRHNQLRDLNGDTAYQHIDATDRTNLDNFPTDVSDLTDNSGLIGNATKIQGFDVTTTDPTDGKILVYRTATSEYVLEDKPASGANPAASDVSFTPGGDIVSINVQDAIIELDTEKASKNFAIAMAISL